MLKTSVKVACVGLASVFFVVIAPAGNANPVDTANCETKASQGNHFGSVSVSVVCQKNKGSDSTHLPGCHRSDGTEVPCSKGDYSWNPVFDKYCKVWYLPNDHPWWDAHRDENGEPVGTFYGCHTYGQNGGNDVPMWDPVAALVNSVQAWSDAEAIVRSAVSSLGLHNPSVGVGAYVCPGYSNWGLTWWVGAPMWLWVDAHDPLQWGVHTISASEGGTTVSATVTASKVQYDPGDASVLVTCQTAGTSRPWNPTELLERHSPSGCEHTYLRTNKLGDVHSRYTVTATVVWNVVWSASDGQSGTFTLPMTSSQPASIHVGELRVVQIADPGQ